MAAEEAPPAKKLKKTMRIGTHSGNFHCDEALACFMLYNHVDQFKGGEIVRSRDRAVWETCDILVDVCGEYVPEENKFDHHQRGFTEVFSDTEPFNRTKLSSAGLIYKHYGREVIADILQQDGLPEEVLELFYQKMYESFIEAVDGIDNGVNQYDSEPHYQSSTNLGSRVKGLNPWWNQPSTNEIMDAQFCKAMELTGSEFKSKIEFYARSWWPARDIVRRAIENRFELHPSGEVIELSQYCPHGRHMMELEEEMELVGVIKFVLFEGSDSSFRVKAVNVSPESFDLRKSLTKEWCGLRDEELSQKSGIADCIFIHSAGFIGGGRTRECARSMAFAAVESS